MKQLIPLPLLAALAFVLPSCGNKEGANSTATLKVSGSNTMAQVSTAWAEAFPGGKVSVGGGGSGIGISELTEGRIDICASSRPMKPEEMAKVKEKQGKEPVQFVVGYDALAIFVHPENPIKEMSIDQLTEIYAEGGTITNWEQVAPGGLTGPMTILGRENTSGTYEYFHDAIVGKNDAGESRKFRSNISTQSSSQSIIDNLATVKSAIGYDGMAFKNDKVNWLAISNKSGDPAVLPNADDARSGKYPIARKLYLYTIGEPAGATKEFIDFALSEEGQKILAGTGYVSLK